MHSKRPRIHKQLSLRVGQRAWTVKAQALSAAVVFELSSGIAVSRAATRQCSKEVQQVHEESLKTVSRWAAPSAEIQGDAME